MREGRSVLSPLSALHIKSQRLTLRDVERLDFYQRQKQLIQFFIFGCTTESFFGGRFRPSPSPDRAWGGGGGPSRDPEYVLPGTPDKNRVKRSFDPKN